MGVGQDDIVEGLRYEAADNGDTACWLFEDNLDWQIELTLGINEDGTEYFEFYVVDMNNGAEAHGVKAMTTTSDAYALALDVSNEMNNNREFPAKEIQR